MEDFDKGHDQIAKVDRKEAEEIALVLESRLPSEAELLQLMRDAAGPVTG